ncbi:GLPGLI family protein [Chryseobacterium sp. C-71]|uniref:GLPGLI family protein n=1 Tax=Chryseobacterium sp. C-71 TaxID=2893882 RepID=UPI001E4A9A90|nr:GLPGLI family protein [Chryseobacterium sp. C-71]UFH31677.1 GLPGLI family protein [Chryseobacterium sp. C-71]
MGKIIVTFFSLLLFLLSDFFFSQGIKASYEITYKPDSTSINKIKETYILKLNGTEKKSIFHSKNYGIDSFNKSIFKNLKKNEFAKYQIILYQTYKSDYNFDTKWVLSREKKEILGYQCNSAQISVGGRRWLAWYSSDLPFQDGPYIFYGLPGLIMEIYSEDGDYRFQIQSLEKFSEKITSPKGFPLGNKEQELNFKMDIIKDPSAQYRQNIMQLKNSQMGISVSYNGKESTDKDIVESINNTFFDWMKKHNNPIEKGDIWIK